MERFAGIIALACATGCFEPRLQDSQISCEADQLCPTGFVCLDGLCRNQGPGDKSDDPDTGPDAGTPDEPTPDAEPPPLVGPKIFDLTAGAWTVASAAEFFEGSGLSSASITTAWSLCDATSQLRCYSDNSNVACKNGDDWFTASSNEIDNNLSSFAPTFNSAFKLGGNTWAFYVHKGEDWRGYEGDPFSTSNGQLNSDFALEVASGQNGVDDLNEIYGNDDNAPATFDDIVADYIDVTQGGDPWTFLTATGQRFTIFADGSDSLGGQDPMYALAGAPAPQDVRAALKCGANLQVYAVK